MTLSQRVTITWVLMVGMVAGLASDRLGVLRGLLVTVVVVAGGSLVGSRLLARRGRLPPRD